MLPCATPGCHDGHDGRLLAVEKWPDGVPRFTNPLAPFPPRVFLQEVLFERAEQRFRYPGGFEVSAFVWLELTKNDGPSALSTKVTKEHSS